jgi:hypothetical protein
MSAYRQQEYIQNQLTALDTFQQQNGYLPSNIPSDVMAAMIAQGANPAVIKKLQEQGAAQQAPGANDPLAGTAGHYYVDETTQPLLGRIIFVRGKRRRLMADKDGRLYYIKPGQSRRRRAQIRQILRDRNAAQLQQPEVRGNMTTALSVILGS